MSWVCISAGKPRIRQAEGRWGEAVQAWYAIEPGFVYGELWERLKAYQRPFALIKAQTLGTSGMEEALRRQMALAPFPNTVWEFNARVNPSGADEPMNLIRMIAIFGEPRLVRWNWWDLHIAYPITKVVAAIRTRLSKKELH